MHLWILVSLFWICKAKDNEENTGRFIIACHTSDFLCFKRQYQSLRDNVLLGNDVLGIPHYEPYIFKYGSTGTCIKLTGLEESKLTGISLDSVTKEFSWTIELPFRIHQVRNDTVTCKNPENEFIISGLREGLLKKFTGNATIQVTYPYELHKRKKDLFITLKDENLDVILDIPDLSSYKTAGTFERHLFEQSEWAYGVVQHIDAAQHFALPFTSQMRTVTDSLPLRRFLLLYPEEEYADLLFKFLEPDTGKCYKKL